MATRPRRDVSVRERARALAEDHAAAPTGTANLWSATRERWRAARERRRVRSPETDRLAREFLAGRRPLFAQRATTGRVIADEREGWADALDVAARAAAERPGDAAALLAAYLECAHDTAATTLGHHFLAWHLDASGHVDRAARHLRLATVRLVLVGGMPGSGKSTLSSALGPRLGASVLSKHSQAHPDWSYQELLRRAAVELGLGRPVVLDASWMSPEHRIAASNLAHDTHSTLVSLCCWAPKATTTRRGGPHSEPCTQAEAHINPWPGASTVNTAGSPADSLTQALDLVEPFRNHPG
ncbi:AAA family ATPase [Prauserella cavernicola]|uniref:AAA family ATPase n=1 Tax=Prauserella cavernicola TaxID=2800127 RepID=A0A934QX50_9PSEU|nr:AAA family ATPase [Prauserella cavernicola]MBK1788280.1 AAA family ATPase [Prauserella cavernicola]